jgi:hypothetical protein
VLKKLHEDELRNAKLVYLPKKVTVKRSKRDVFEVVKEHHRYNSLFDATAVTQNLRELGQQLQPENLIGAAYKRSIKKLQDQKCEELSQRAPVRNTRYTKRSKPIDGYSVLRDALSQPTRCLISPDVAGSSPISYENKAPVVSKLDLARLRPSMHHLN